MRNSIVFIAWGFTSLLCWVSFGQVIPFYPIFNFDLLLSAVLACFLPTVAWALHVGAAAVAVVMAVAALFHFQSPIDLFIQSSASGLDLTNLSAEYWYFGLVIATAVITGWLGANTTRRQDIWWITFVLILIIMADLFGISGYLRPSRFGATNITGSPTLGFVNHHILNPPRQIVSINDSSKLADRTVSWAISHPGKDILWVISESLGAPQDPHIMKWLNDSLINSLPDEYRSNVGTTPFKGATTAAELRQLCSLTGGYDKLNPSDLNTCLPWRLSALGMRTRGLHAFSGHMFQRSRWWPQIGLQQSFFFEELISTMPSQRCGKAFRGLCDSDLVDFALEDNLQQVGQFTYILTLNTHLPLATSEEIAFLPVICQERSLPSQSCNLLWAHHQFFDHLGKTLKRRLDKPLVVIVGDHAPPFVFSTDRSVFQSDKVPYWFLEPSQ